MVAIVRSASQSGHIHSEERTSVVQGVGYPLSGVPMGRRAGGLLEVMENLLPLPGIKPLFLGIAHFLTTTPSTLARLSLEVLRNPSQDANARFSTFDVQTSGLPLIPLLT